VKERKIQARKIVALVMVVCLLMLYWAPISAAADGLSIGAPNTGQGISSISQLVDRLATNSSASYLVMNAARTQNASRTHSGAIGQVQMQYVIKPGWSTDSNKSGSNITGDILTITNSAESPNTAMTTRWFTDFLADILTKIESDSQNAGADLYIATITVKSQFIQNQTYGQNTATVSFEGQEQYVIAIYKTDTETSIVRVAGSNTDFNNVDNYQHYFVNASSSGDATFKYYQSGQTTTQGTIVVPANTTLNARLASLPGRGVQFSGSGVHTYYKTNADLNLAETVERVVEAASVPDMGIPVKPDESSSKDDNSSSDPNGSSDPGDRDGSSSEDETPSSSNSSSDLTSSDDTESSSSKTLEELFNELYGSSSTSSDPGASDLEAIADMFEDEKAELARLSEQLQMGSGSGSTLGTSLTGLDLEDSYIVNDDDFRKAALFDLSEGNTGFLFDLVDNTLGSVHPALKYAFMITAVILIIAVVPLIWTFLKKGVKDDYIK